MIGWTVPDVAQKLHQFQTMQPQGIACRSHQVVVRHYSHGLTLANLFQIQRKCNHIWICNILFFATECSYP